MEKGVSVAVFLEGVRVDVSRVSVFTELASPTKASISIPFIHEDVDIMLTTHVAIFIKYTYLKERGSALDDYVLAFHGEVEEVRNKRNGISMECEIMAVDSSHYLNKMPSQFTWALIEDKIYERERDYNFLGLDFMNSDGGTAKSRWFTDASGFKPILMRNVRGTQAVLDSGSRPGGLGDSRSIVFFSQHAGSRAVNILKRRDQDQDFAPLGKPVDSVPIYDSSGRRINYRRQSSGTAGIRTGHMGEDYGGNSHLMRRGTSLFCPYNDVQIRSYRNAGTAGNYLSLILPSPKLKANGDMETPRECQARTGAPPVVQGKTVDLMHLQECLVGPAVTVCNMWHHIGKVGNTGVRADGSGYQVHLHIQMKDSNYWYSISRTHEDLLHRILGVNYEEYIRRSHGLSYRSPEATAGIRGVSATGETMDREDFPTYKLDEYVGGVVDLLANAGGQYIYYYNANQRYKIKGGFTVKDFPVDAFEGYYGADWYDSFMRNQFDSLYKYEKTVIQNLYNGLANIGYAAYSTSIPKYDSQKKSLKEYFVSPVFMWHKPPPCNLISIDSEYDTFNIGNITMPVSVIKYKKNDSNGVATINSTYSPPGAERVALGVTAYIDIVRMGSYSGVNLGDMMEIEELYGIRRKTKDISYYYQTYLERLHTAPDNGRSVSGVDLFQRLCDMERLLGNSNDTLAINRHKLCLDIVVGLPAIVHVAEAGRKYWGLVQSISHVIDVVNGVAQTSLIIGHVTGKDKTGLMEGINIGGAVESSINAGLREFYSGSFFSSDLQGEMYREDDFYNNGIDGDYYPRSKCTLRQYLSMYGESDLSPLEQYVEATQIQDLTKATRGDSVIPSKTIEQNSAVKLVVNRVSDIFIRERYLAAKTYADTLVKKRVLIAKGE